MTDDVWMSSVMTNHSIGDKQGAREKYFGREWAPASDIFHSSEDAERTLVHKYRRGEALARKELTEAMFVFDHARWSKQKDLFYAGNFYAVKGRLAEVFQEFDLGDGGLIEFPIYEEDKETPVAGGPFYLLNFGCIKETFVPEESRNIRPRRTVEDHGYELWKDNSGVRDGDIALRRTALQGCDLWVERKYEERLFMSGRLHDAIEAADTGVDFRFAKCRFVD